MKDAYFNIPHGTNPWELFGQWFAEASQSEVNDPDAAALATVSDTVWPNVRMVLVKKVDENGFVFFTNMKSQKGKELEAVERAALCYHWKSLGRQVRVQGDIQPVSAEDADAHFAARHPKSQRGAIVSKQSSPLADRETLERLVNEFTEKFPDDATLKRPIHWSGYHIVPRRIEFWQDGENRLHDRFAFTRETPDSAWSVTRLFP